VSILADGARRELEVDPWVRRVTLRVPPTGLDEQLPDWHNVQRALGAQAGALQPLLRALRQLPGALRAQEGLITLLVADAPGGTYVIRVDPGAGPERLLGIAFDIGTTTVVGYLMDLETGAQLAVSSLLNPQTRYGDDVVSRIEYATTQPQGLETLQREIVGAMNTIIHNAALAALVSAHDILALTAVGNTTMQHLFLGISPSALAQAPYVPAFSQGVCIRAHELCLAIYPDAIVCALPSIAGWVGADTVGVILSTGVHRQPEIALAIDIGTNGEMALGSARRLITCSTAAGPAFEGAHLSCGMRAADGAVDAVQIDAQVHWHAIGEAAPRGVCGSGLVDTVAELLRNGILDATGMMLDSQVLHDNGRCHLAERITSEGRRRQFRLVDEAQGAGGRAIAITQRDVRELQLAKGAIRAGIEILMKELGIGPEDVAYVYLAGAFGNYIKPESALGIGLMPRFPNATLVPVGNAAGSGAKMALLSRAARQEADAIVGRVEYLELSGRADFQGEFAEAMVF
ncbi:MAG: ASKHA domain-containing protein, partial [Chloroflexota bacterium]